ncbi:HalOD1 output domain-containing protein [Halegenticoccus soli]|uniref:HalOD1 output domain-containing protein n=1 Tax=Halegenticoccus soli TaxID=1985678 RepID=UPI00130476EA
MTCHVPNHRNLSETIIRMLAEGNSPPEALPPLYESIDPDALDSLFSRRGVDGTIEFEHAGCRIVVHGNREIQIEESPDESV